MLLLGDYVMQRDISLEIEIDERELVLCNLEGPVLPRLEMNLPLSVPYSHPKSKSLKAGPHQCSTVMPPFGSRGVYALANNHFMDYGLEGVKSSLEALDIAGARYCGFGWKQSEARRGIIVKDSSGARLGIISCCERQFGGSFGEEAGVAEWGPWVYGELKRLREITDFVIVSSHAGIEMSPWPYPQLQEFYRSLIDLGADIVYGHHSHLPQGLEAYRKGLILYGLGNFAAEDEEYRDSYYGLYSLGVRVEFIGKEFKWDLLPLKMDYSTEGGAMRVCTLQDLELKSFCEQYLYRCSLPLQDRDFLNSLWQEIAVRYFRIYGDSLWGRNRGHALKRFLKKILCHEREIQQEYILRYLLYACESHRQMMKTALAVLCGVERDVRTSKASAWVDEMIPSTAKEVRRTT